jgi:hypothetical protein
MRPHDTYFPLRNGTAKQFKFCNRYAVDEYALERSVLRMEGRSGEERCEEQTGSSQTHGTSNYKGYVTSVPGVPCPWVSPKTDPAYRKGGGTYR